MNMGDGTAPPIAILPLTVSPASDMRPGVVHNDWCVFTEKVWSLLPQRTAQMVLQEIGVVMASDCPMLGHSMCEDDAGIFVGENDHNLSIAGILPHFGFAG